jgi:hypothetical protein
MSPCPSKSMLCNSTSLEKPPVETIDRGGGQTQSVTCHEVTEGDKTYSSILSLNLYMPLLFVPEIGSGPTSGLDGYGKFRSPEGFERQTVQPVASLNYPGLQTEVRFVKYICWIFNGLSARLIITNLVYLQTLRYTYNVHICFPRKCCWIFFLFRFVVLPSSTHSQQVSRLFIFTWSHSDTHHSR